MITCAFTASPAPLNWDKQLLFSLHASLPFSLWLSIFTASLIHQLSSSLLLCYFFILLSTIPFRSRNWTIWLEADIKNLLPLHSVLSLHVNERKTSLRSVLFKISCHLLCRFISSSNSPPPQRKSFIPFSPHIFFQFQDIEHEKDSIMIEEVENGKRGVNLTKKSIEHWVEWEE